MLPCNVEMGLAFAACFHVLQHATCTDSATTLQINQHPVLSASFNRRRDNTNSDTIDLQELIVLVLEILWHLVVCSVDPAIAHRRAEVVPNESASGLLVVFHVLFLSHPICSVKHRSPIVVTGNTLQGPCQRYGWHTVCKYAARVLCHLKRCSACCIVIFSMLPSL